MPTSPPICTVPLVPTLPAIRMPVLPAMPAMKVMKAMKAVKAAMKALPVPKHSLALVKKFAKQDAANKAKAANANMTGPADDGKKGRVEKSTLKKKPAGKVTLKSNYNLYHFAILVNPFCKNAMANSVNTFTKIKDKIVSLGNSSVVVFEASQAWRNTWT